MNLSYLQTFLAVVETGNLNKAADRLNVTQSTVTTRLDTLDESLGQALLKRSRKGAVLTKAGFAFKKHAELIVSTWDLGRKTVGLPKGYSGHFSLACHHDLWEGLGKQIISKILAEREELAVEAWPGDMGEIKDWLSSGLVDAALTIEPVAGFEMESMRLKNDRLVQVSSVKRQVRSWDEDYIFVDHGAEFRRAHAIAWPTGETPRITLASSQWALDHLLENGGSAYLPWRLVKSYVEADSLFLIEGAQEFERSVQLIWREGGLDLKPFIDVEG